jgi:hypothetical protein
MLSQLMRNRVRVCARVRVRDCHTASRWPACMHAHTEKGRPGVSPLGSLRRLGSNAWIYLDPFGDFLLDTFFAGDDGFPPGVAGALDVLTALEAAGGGGEEGR